MLCLQGLLVYGAAALFLAPADADTQSDQPRFDPQHTVPLVLGDLVVVIGDHYEHGSSGREGYTGIHHLSHLKRPSSVFCPLYAGMIGVRRECHIQAIGYDTARIWVGKGADRIVETHRVTPPHYIDYTAEFTATGTEATWNNTSYMNGPADPGIHVRGLDGSWVRHYSSKHGHEASVAPEGMEIPPIPQVADSQYPHGGRGFHEGFSELRYDPRYPVYYGRFDDMVLIFMMERDKGPYFVPDMSPTGGGYSQEWDRNNPAWDHRFHLKGLTPGQQVVVRQRLCYKPYVSDDDVVAEYERWLTLLAKQDGDATQSNE